MALVREPTISTEPPPLVGCRVVSAPVLCGRNLGFLVRFQIS
jgi:hypothetical protein